MRGFAEAYRTTQDTGGVAAHVAREEHICASCLALAHYWNTPEHQVTELCGEPYSLLVFRCVCQCQCPAILATAATGQPPRPPEGSEATS